MNTRKFLNALLAGSMFAFLALGTARADNPQKTPAKPDTPAAAPATKPAAAPAATPAVAPAAAEKPELKLTPEQEKQLGELKVKMAEMQAEQAKLALTANRMQLEKAALDLAMAKRSMMEMMAQDDVNGVYMFMEPVTQETVKKAISDLNKLSRRMTGPQGQHLPITIVLDSPGGEVVNGLALYAHIRDLHKRGHHMIVKVRGEAASMGGVILQAGDERIISEDAYLLIHEVSSGARGKVSEMRDQLAFSEKLWDHLVKILAKKSKLKAADIKEKTAGAKDWWLDAEEAVKLGFADKID